MKSTKGIASYRALEREQRDIMTSMEPCKTFVVSEQAQQLAREAAKFLKSPQPLSKRTDEKGEKIGATGTCYEWTPAFEKLLKQLTQDLVGASILN